MMQSSVLNSPRAIRVNIEIMRAFVRLRELLASNADLARRLDELEQKYDAQSKVVFEAIRQLTAPARADQHDAERQVLASGRDTLLPKLLSGGLRVREAEWVAVELRVREAERVAVELRAREAERVAVEAA